MKGNTTIHCVLAILLAVMVSCAQPDPAAKAPLTDTPHVRSMPPDTGVARAMDSTINSPDKRIDK